MRQEPQVGQAVFRDADHSGEFFDQILESVPVPFRDKVTGFQCFDQTLHDGAAGAAFLMQFFPVHVVVGFFKQGVHIDWNRAPDCVAHRQADGPGGMTGVVERQIFFDLKTGVGQHFVRIGEEQDDKFIAADAGDDVAGAK